MKRGGEGERKAKHGEILPSSFTHICLFSTQVVIFKDNLMDIPRRSIPSKPKDSSPGLAFAKGAMVENRKRHRQNSNLINDFPTSEGVSEVSERANE